MAKLDLYEKYRWLCLSLLMAMAACVYAQRSEYSVRDYGALGDSLHIDSPAINDAIAAAAQGGGGTVRVPAGVYLCYSIRMQSHVTLLLDSGAVIRAAAPTAAATYDLPEDNPSRYQDFGHSHWQNSLIWGIGLTDIAFEGQGLIDGSDVLSRGLSKNKAGLPVANKAIALRECRDVKLRDLRMLNCGHFALLLTGVDNLTIEGMTIDTNRDGIDIDCCENVIVRDCRVNTLNDDAIVLKTSYALNRLKPTQNVLIERCHVSGYDPGTLLSGSMTTLIDRAPDGDGPTGRIKLGTESNGDFRNVIIRDCTLTHCRGLALETVDGGQMENVTVERIQMRDICNSPFYLRAGSRNRGPKGLPASSIKHVSISHVTVEDADSRYASIICGIDAESIRDVQLSHIRLQYRGGITLDDVRTGRGANTFFRDPKHPTLQGYPEPSAHGIQPASGFAISHASDLTFSDVEISFIQPDERPLVYLEDVKNVKGLETESSPKGEVPL